MRTPVLLAAAGLVLGGLGVISLITPRGEDPGAPVSPAQGDGAAGGALAPLARPSASMDPADTPSPAGGTGSAPERTPQVVRPRSGSFGPAVAPPVGSAGLAAAIRLGGIGTPAQLELLAGPNRGRVLVTERDGTLEVEGLFPGLALVRVTCGSESATRELVLRHAKQVELALDFGAFPTVAGRVVDEEQLGVPGAEVSLDGHEVVSLADGGFLCQRRASGPALLIVRKPGFSSYRVAVPEGQRDPLAVELRPGARLELSIVGGTGEGWLYVVPDKAQRLSGHPPQPAFPWHELNPVAVPLGGRVLLEDLPAGRVVVYAVGVSCRGRSGNDVWLHPSRVEAAALQVQELPLLEGCVLCGEAPVPGAPVSLVAADRMRATLAAFGGEGEFYLSQPIELLPSAEHSTRTDERGHFQLPWWPGIRDRFLTVRSPAGGTTVTRALGGREELVIDLANPSRAQVPGSSPLEGKAGREQ